METIPFLYQILTCGKSLTHLLLIHQQCFKVHFHSIIIFNVYLIASIKTSIKMKALIFFALLLIIGLSFQDILRLECQSYADFSIVLHNVVDTGIILKIMVTKGLRECVLNCISLSGCKAINFRKVDKRCELLALGFNKNLIEKAGWIYSTTDELRTKVNILHFEARQDWELILSFLKLIPFNGRF